MNAVRAAAAVPVLETDRLALRQFTTDDAEFILDLLNDPSFLRHIGDKGVRTRADAVRYVPRQDPSSATNGSASGSTGWT